jgi:ATP synthase protein I
MLIRSKPIRTMLRWQLYATGALTLIAGIWAGPHGAISAMLGGVISTIAALIYGLIISRVGVTSAGQVLRIAMRAEASKIALMVIQLWLVLTLYKSVVMVAFFTAFIATVLMFSMALLVSDE